MLVDGRGYILTNHHVVDKVQGIVVALFDGTSYPAHVLQSDPVMDLALLKVDADQRVGRGEDRHLVRPDGRRDGDHDRQCIWL